MYKTIASLVAAGVISVAAVNNQPMIDAEKSDDSAAGWVSLFDGKTTTGWHSYKKTGVGKVWKVTDGTIHLDAEAKKQSPAEGGDLVTNEEFENFHLKLEWKVAPKANSGVILFVNEDPAYNNTYESGMEMQVLDNGTPTTPGHPDGKLYTHRAGDLYDLLAAKEAAKPVGEWNAAEVKVKNGKLDFYLNGEHTLSTTLWDANWKAMVGISKFRAMSGFGKFIKGHIALQDHGDAVQYRNIKIRRL